MNLKEEFKASFGNYVPPDRQDMRRAMLDPVLEIPVALLVDTGIIEPHDLAAMLTCAVAVDPRLPQVYRLVREVQEWQEARQTAEDNYDDPDEVTYDPVVNDVPFAFDRTVEGLGDFLENLRRLESGNRYLGQVLTCLVWARKIPEMIPNLWKEAS